MEQVEEVFLQLEKHHAVFSKLFGIGVPIFTDDIDTAAIEFDQAGRFFRFLFNQKFWDSLNDEERKFVLCHEALHVILNHGTRFQNRNRRLANIAGDIAINEMLLRHFGFSLQKMENLAQGMVLCESVFPGEGVEPDQEMEYYYDLLKKRPNKNLDKLSDLHETVSGTPQDLEEILEELSADELSSLRNQTSSDFGAGTTPGTTRYTIDEILKLKRKKRWSSLIKQYRRKDFAGHDMGWTRKSRRHMLLPPDFILPTISPNRPENKKALVRLYLDVSGSCGPLVSYFWSASKTIPEDRFEIELFSFDTQVHEIKGDRIPGGGGTSFHAVVSHAKRMEKTRGPADALFVFTDGDANKPKVKSPLKWHWFIGGSYATKRGLPDGCHTHKLSDFVDLKR